MSDRVIFTKEMKKTYKILCPNMANIHFEMLREVFVNEGYDMEVLYNTGPSVVSCGLKYVHNDTCYPALLVIGQMIDALQSGKYDVHKTALLITQTGGGCRASNYIHLLRKALKKAGLEFVPVISLNMSGLESNPGFKLTLSLLRKFLAGLDYGDVMMQLSNQVRPYEVNKGDTDALLHELIHYCANELNHGRGYGYGDIRKNLAMIVKRFKEIPVNKSEKIKVGVVGEIYVKYAPLGNNHLEEFLQSQDCEYMVPGLMGFALFKVDNRLEDIKLYGGSKAKKVVCQILFDYLIKHETLMREAIEQNSDFIPAGKYSHTKELVKDVVGYGSKMGEGWLLTAEMMELTECGYKNIVCTQPFGCLPNHINGKGMIRKITEKMPDANIVPIDYDPSATAVNQENRIKLMLAMAKEKMEETV
ncbi:MAG: 2-hydroxyacyl-CoA dehydratase [Erysipelotrichaceae bacterium]|nr:2-hydroxyacyl-CoA dehydratase [Erysipelotrichaceae bacterium]